MNTAMNSPKIDVADRPRSLMIFTSWPAVSWPIRYDAPVIRIAKSDEIVEDLVAHRLAEDVHGDRGRDPHRASAAPSSPRVALSTSGDITASTNKSSSVSRIGLSDDEVRAGGGEIGQQRLGRRLERQLQRVASLADLAALRTRAPKDAISCVARAGDDELPAARAERQHVGEAPARRRDGPLRESRRGCTALRRRSGRAS